MSVEFSGSVPEPVPNKIVIKVFEAELSAAIERIDRHYLPLLQLEEKRVQNLMTLSAGAIVASLTVFQAIGTAHLQGKALLALTWAAFIVTIVVGLAITHDLYSLRTFGWALMSRRREALDELLPQWAPDMVEEMVGIKVNELVEKVDKDLASHRTDLPAQFRVAGFSFLIGICLFVIFGVINLF